MAPIAILMIGVGGWLMYEAYKGSTASDLRTKVRAAAGGTATASGPTSAAGASGVSGILAGGQSVYANTEAV